MAISMTATTISRRAKTAPTLTWTTGTVSTTATTITAVTMGKNMQRSTITATTPIT